MNILFGSTLVIPIKLTPVVESELASRRWSPGAAFLFEGGAEKLVGQLKAEGFAQFLQLDFAMLARRELNVTGEPPFMGGIFHLF